MENWNTNSTTSDPIQFFTARIYRKYESIRPPPPGPAALFFIRIAVTLVFFLFPSSPPRNVRKLPAKYELSCENPRSRNSYCTLAFPPSTLFFHTRFFLLLTSWSRRINLTSYIMHSSFKFLQLLLPLRPLNNIRNFEKVRKERVYFILLDKTKCKHSRRRCFDRWRRRERRNRLGIILKAIFRGFKR